MSNNVEDNKWTRMVGEKKMVTAAVKLGAVHESLQLPLDLNPDLTTEQEEFLQEHHEFATNFFEDNAGKINVDSWRADLYDDSETVEDPDVDQRYDIDKTYSAADRSELADEIFSHANRAAEFRDELYVQTLGHNNHNNIDVSLTDENIEQFVSEIQNTINTDGVDEEYLDTKFNELQKYNSGRFDQIEDLSENYFNSLIETIGEETLDSREISYAVGTAIDNHVDLIDESQVYNQVTTALENYDFTSSGPGYDQTVNAVLEGIRSSDIATEADIDKLRNYIESEHQDRSNEHEEILEEVAGLRSDLYEDYEPEGVLERIGNYFTRG